MSIFLERALEYHQENGGSPKGKCEILMEWKKGGNACLISIDCQQRTTAMLFAWFSEPGWVLKRQLTEAQDEPKLVRPGESTHHHEGFTNFRKRFLDLPDGGLVC
jgi:hypothetical protein